MNYIKIYNFIGCIINLIVALFCSIIIGLVFNSIIIMSTLAILKTFLITVLYLFINHRINCKYL